MSNSIVFPSSYSVYRLFPSSSCANDSESVIHVLVNYSKKSFCYYIYKNNLSLFIMFITTNFFNARKVMKTVFVKQSNFAHDYFLISE